MENKQTSKWMDAVKAAKNEKELLDLAKENGKELKEGQAAALFKKLHEANVLTDEDLEAVAGGAFFSMKADVPVACAEDGSLKNLI